MKTLVLFFAVCLVAHLTGCQAVSQHNAKTAADIKVGQDAAAQGKLAAQQALEAVKGIKSAP